MKQGYPHSCRALQRCYAKIISIMNRGEKIKAILCSVIGLLLIPAAVFAESAISQGFPTSEALHPGTIVSRQEKEKGIEQATSASTDRLLGVVSDTSLLELSDDGMSQAQVVTNGLALTLVSNINGDIKVGDFVTASPLKGVGMKTLETGYVIGVAQANFADIKAASERTITDKSGKQKVITVGLMPVQIDVTHYEKQDDKKSIVPQFILNIAQAVSGKQVSVVRVLAALLVLIVGTISIGVMLYASVRSSIASIGRNPLAAAAVNRGLLEISFLTLGILAVMLTAMYLILVL